MGDKDITVELNRSFVNFLCKYDSVCSSCDFKSSILNLHYMLFFLIYRSKERQVQQCKYQYGTCFIRAAVEKVYTQERLVTFSQNMLSIVREELSARYSWLCIIRSSLLAEVVHLHVLTRGLNLGKVNSSTLHSLLIFTQSYRPLLLLLFSELVGFLLFLIVFHLIVIIFIVSSVGSTLSHTPYSSSTTTIVATIISPVLGTTSIWGITAMSCSCKTRTCKGRLHFFLGNHDLSTCSSRCSLLLHIKIDDHVEGVCVALRRHALLVTLLAPWLSQNETS